MPDFDIISVGGGLGGASVAKAMAERGARVLVTEREAKFKDRVRGEWLAPWGVAEARELGIYETLISDCGYHPTGWDTRLAGNSIGLRDLAATTKPAVHPMTFFHPRAQEALLEAAETARAEVRRGVRVSALQPGGPPRVTLEANGRSESLTARLVVGADGRGSMVRKWGGFDSKDDPDQQWLAGILIENTAAPMDYSVGCVQSLRFAYSANVSSGRSPGPLLLRGAQQRTRHDGREGRDALHRGVDQDWDEC